MGQQILTDIQKEIKTISYILKKELHEKDKIESLETDFGFKRDIPASGVFPGTGYNVFDLIPTYPLKAKVSIKERKAPLVVKFEYFDAKTGQPTDSTDTFIKASHVEAGH